MPAANVETREATQEPTVADRIADTVRRAAHVSHEARLMRSLARDVGEEGLHAAKRALQRARRRGADALEDVEEEAAHYVKRQPFTAVGIAAGVGLLVGVVVGAIGATLGRRAMKERGGTR
jgi:ElaB/YqjD/DUF883 family membrane-anchored ribosome-binding protein